MVVPNLSKSDREYLSAATSNKEFMNRMTSIARRLDHERHQQVERENIETSDDYIEKLSRRSSAAKISKLDASAPAIATEPSYDGSNDDRQQPFDKDLKTEENVEDVEDKIQALQRELLEADSMQGANVKEVAVEEDSEEVQDNIDFEAGAAQITALQKQIQEEMGLTNTQGSVQENGEDKQTPLSVDTSEVETMEKQISFLENYITKLQDEATKEKDPTSVDDQPVEATTDLDSQLESTVNQLSEHVSRAQHSSPSIEGLEGISGEFTAAEKAEVFEALKTKALNAKPSSEFADPYNVKLPERAHSEGDQPSSSEEEYDAMGLAVGGNMGDRELLVKEIDTEVMAYTRDAKSLLKKHETRMAVLLARLRASFEI